MTNQATALSTDLWRTQPAAHEAEINPADATTGESGNYPLARDIANRLASSTGATATSVTYRESARDVPTAQLWQTITVEIAERTVVFAAKPDPFVIAEWVWDIYIDGAAIPYAMTYARPLAEVLSTAARRGMQSLAPARPGSHRA